MNAIDARGLARSFRGRRAVNGLSLAIEEGEIFALLGQNGAGKTTTIRMLCGLLRPDAGDAFLLGKSVAAEPEEVKRIINVSPQETAVAPKLSVQENLMLIARIYGAGREEAEARSAEMLRAFHMEGRAKDRAKSLSGGLQRRLSLAMALISQPKILFLDEPTLGLDVRARLDLWDYIRSLKGRMTIVLTTHYLEEAESLADRIGIMSRGEMKLTGTAEEIRAQTGTETLEQAFLMLTDEEENE